MSRFVLLIVVVYVIGICVELAPVARASWDSVPASELAANLVDHLPAAAVWPMRVIHSLTGKTKEGAEP